MKTFNKILLILISLIYSGCENSDIVEISLPYEENVVVQAQLVAGEIFQGVRITKTLPANETYTISKAEVKNAYVYLKINNIHIIGLHYTTEGIYLPADTLLVKTRDKIEIFGKVDDTPFYSQTYVPSNPTIINSGYVSNGSYMEATVQAQANEVYGGLWVIDRYTNTSAEDFYSITSPENNNTTLKVRTAELPEIYRSSVYSGRRFIQIYSFDPQFKEFFNSKNNNQPISNYFIEGGGSISWNVYGDHTIGLFIGMAKSHL